MNASDALLPLARDGDEPVFAEAWHAEALAIAFALTSAGLFSVHEWAQSLGAELRATRARGAPDTPEHYYEALLAALEGLIARRAPAVSGLLGPRVEQWRRAYLNTPHGQPVELSAGAEPPRA